MKFPHPITILRPNGLDAYGNQSASFAAPLTTDTVAFIVQKASSTGEAQLQINLALLPPETDIRSSDRVRHGTTLYEVVGDVVTASSPSKAVIRSVTLREVRGG